MANEIQVLRGNKIYMKKSKKWGVFVTGDQYTSYFWVAYQNDYSPVISGRPKISRTDCRKDMLKTFRALGWKQRQDWEWRHCPEIIK